MNFIVRFGLSSEQLREIKLNIDDPIWQLHSKLEKKFGVPQTCQKLISENVRTTQVWPRICAYRSNETVATVMMTLGVERSDVHLRLLCDPSGPISDLNSTNETYALLRALSDLSIVGLYDPTSRDAIRGFVNGLKAKDLIIRDQEVIRTAMRAFISTSKQDTLELDLCLSYRLILLENAIEMEQIDLIHTIFVAWPGESQSLSFCLRRLSDENFKRALVLSIEKHNFFVTKALLDTFANWQLYLTLDPHGNTALMHAAWHNSLPTVRAILKRATNGCSKTNYWGETALQMAERRGNAEVLQLLQMPWRLTDDI